MSDRPVQGVPLRLRAGDGYGLKGFVWRHDDAAHGVRPVVIINSATSVLCQYYGRFAAFLYRHGFDVVTYDYRGIGESRPPSLKGFKARWIDWGQLDFEAVLQYVVVAFPGQPVQVVAHSVGGLLVGLAASSYVVSRVFTIGAQFAYWRDYAPDRRAGLVLKWHVFMPMVTALFGYFPGKRLGWLEDTPRGVVRDWTARCPRFEDTYRRGPGALTQAERAALVERFASVRAPMLAVSVSDDEFATVPAVQRLLRYYSGSATTHLHVAPDSVGTQQIGHFAFFNRRFEHTLWQLALEWLRSGQLPADAPGQVVQRGARA